MSRDIPFDNNVACDDCGKIGSYDFMGDYLCTECFVKYMESESFDNESEEEI